MSRPTAIDAATTGDPLDVVAEWLATRQSERPPVPEDGNRRHVWLEMFRRGPNETDTAVSERLLWFIRDFRHDESVDVVGKILPVIDAVEPGDDFEATRTWADQLMAQAERDQADLDAMEALLLGSTIERVQHSYSVAAWEDRYDG